MTWLPGVALSRPGIAQSFAQRFAFQQLHHQKWRAFMGADVENGKNIGVIQRAGGAGFLFETFQTLSITRKRSGKNLYRDVAPQARVARSIYFAIPPAPMDSIISYGPSLKPALSGIWERDYTFPLQNRRGQTHGFLKTPFRSHEGTLP